ncbi:cell division protein FtsK [Leuconostoc lactis]|uniref:cell division protein FtsK n=1 Tax=Leuconostoc lactis TaxID=1246 RepID=UPI0024AE09E8|nr:cell division protein FtsK [Leuconostoc lactis]MDI6572931.1 cell division protein FtsK [Leuconostoc lactis]
MFKAIKYSDQYLAKTSFKRALLFILILVTFLFLPWYLAIVKNGIATQFTWWSLLPLILTSLVVSVFGWFLKWLYRDYALEHDNTIAHYLRAIELKQLISLLIVSKGFYDIDSDEQGQFVSYFPKVRIKFLFKTGQIILEEPVDGQKYMERFSKGEFDNTVEIALLADRQTTEFEKNKMISTFAFDPIKFRRQLKDLKPKKGLLQISKGIDWKYDTFYNALISGNVGTGKSYTMFAIIGQLLQVTKYVDIIDPKRSDLASLKYVDELKGRVHSTASEINNAVIKYYQLMMKRAERMEELKASGHIGTYKDFSFEPCFLIFDEFGAFVEMNDRLAYDDPIKASYDTAMSNLNEIAMLGRELGFYILIGMQRPDAGSLPMAVRNQLNMRINMGVPTPEIEKMVFPDNEKQLRPLSSHLKGWGFIKIGDSQVRSFFAPEVPRDFNLHEYMRENITIRESQG